MKPLISIIIPVYNAEQYLPECIESIVNQTYHNLEIILIDDGSTDGSLSVCREYARKDLRIQIIEIPHNGVVQARITGVKAAKGEYCMFVDSDDWIAEDLLEIIIPLTLNGVDVVNYNMKIMRETVEDEWNYVISEGVYEKDQLETIYKNMMFSFAHGCPGIIQSLCTKLIRRDLLWESIACMDCRITMGEDAAVTYPVMLCANKIVITNKCLYYYRVHSDSMCTSQNLDIFSKIYYFQQYMKNAFAKYDKRFCLEEQLQAYMIHFIEKGIRDIFALELKTVYRVPFYKLPNMCGKIVLYGAGKVGKSYYRQLRQIKEIEIVAWIDKQENQSIYGYTIENVNILSEIQFDKVLIAVMNEKAVQEIIQELRRFVSEEKIVWDEPQVDRWEKEI